MAIAILSIIYHIAKYKKIRLVQHWKYLTLGFLLLVLVIALKSFIGPIKTGNYELLFDRITDFDHYISVLIQNESTIITFNLNSIIDHNFIYPPEDYLYNNLILPFLPFLKNIHEPNLFNF
ncbi:hypothetical protein, partial [Sunxiuqinia dokdonensis]|uniref:hypothetical protein n=1 Tax=Sunxiuqinia dokdonensis TaxID=1409788 RepID=UPI0019556D99